MASHGRVVAREIRSVPSYCSSPQVAMYMSCLYVCTRDGPLILIFESDTVACERVASRSVSLSSSHSTTARTAHYPMPRSP